MALKKIDVNAEAVGVLLREIVAICESHRIEVDYAYRSGWYEGVLLAIAHGVTEPKRAAKKALERFDAWREMTVDGYAKPRRRKK